MKSLQILLIGFLSLVLTSCNSNKNTADNDLYNTTWELEYITGPRIAFEGLFPDKKPKITFNKETKKVTGNNSCNGYSADFTIDGNTITFSEPGPTTMMFCGEGENVFLKTMKKINAFSITDGKLNLMLDDVDMMRFHKVE